MGADGTTLRINAAKSPPFLTKDDLVRYGWHVVRAAAMLLNFLIAVFVVLLLLSNVLVIPNIVFGFNNHLYSPVPVTAVQWYGDESLVEKPMCQIFVGTTSGHGSDSDMLFVKGVCPFDIDDVKSGWGYGFGNAKPNDASVYNTLYRDAGNTTTISITNMFTRSYGSGDVCDSHTYGKRNSGETDGKGTWNARLALQTSDNEKVVVQPCTSSVLMWQSDPKDYDHYGSLLTIASVSVCVLFMILCLMIVACCRDQYGDHDLFAKICCWILGTTGAIAATCFGFGLSCLRFI